MAAPPATSRTDDFGFDGLDDLADSIGDVLSSALLSASGSMGMDALMAMAPELLGTHPSFMHPDDTSLIGGVGAGAGAGVGVVGLSAGVGGGACVSAAPLPQLSVGGGSGSASSAPVAAPCAAAAHAFRETSVCPDGKSWYPIHVIVLPKAVYAWIGGPVAENSRATPSTLDSLIAITPPLVGGSAPSTTLLHAGGSYGGGGVDLDAISQRLVRRLKRVVLLSCSLPDTPDTGLALPLLERALIQLVDTA